MVKTPLVAPNGIVNDTGTKAELLELVRVTTAPDATGNPVRVTVPVDELPPCTDAGLRLSD